MNAASIRKTDKNHFRVAIFGSARIMKNDPRYRLVYKLAKAIAKEGYDIVTGGGPGLMDAASHGHHAGRKNNHVHSIGLTIRLPREQKESYHLDIKKDFRKFSGRLDNFMALSHALVVAPGGVGTLLELCYSWQLVQVGHVEPKPVILLGSMWKPFIAWVKHGPLRNRLLSDDDFRLLSHAGNCEEAMDIIRKTYRDYRDRNRKKI